MHRLIKGSVVALMATITSTSVAMALPAGEFSEAIAAGSSLQGLMWVAVVVVFVGALGYGGMMLMGRSWWDGLKTMGITCVGMVIAGVIGVRLLAPMIAQAETPTPIAIEEVIE